MLHIPGHCRWYKKKRPAIEISVKLRLEFTKLFTDPGIHKIMELIKHKNIQESQRKKTCVIQSAHQVCFNRQTETCNVVFSSAY